MELSIKSFVDYLQREKKYSPNTLSAYQGDLEQFRAFLQAEGSVKDVASVIASDKEMLSRYLHSLRNKKYSVSTIARKIASIKSLIKYMVDTGKIKDDVAPSISSPKVNKPAPQPLTVSEVRMFLAEPDKKNSIESKRDKAMLELLYATGLRASELMGLNTDDMNFETGTVTCRKDRTKLRDVPMDAYIAKIVRDYMQDCRIKLVNSQNEPALFVNTRGERLTRQGFWQIIQGYADRINLEKKITPRSLRHSFAIHRLHGGADLHTMQELLGHAHISTTRVYQDVRTRS